MPDLSYPDIIFRPIDAFDEVSGFHSTERELDDFLLEDAIDNQENRLSVTFLAFHDDRIAGYFIVSNIPVRPSIEFEYALP